MRGARVPRAHEMEDAMTRIPSIRWVVGAVLAIGLAAEASAGDFLYTVSSGDDNLRIVDAFTGQTTSTLQMSLTSGTIQQCNGLALNPGTQDLWVIVKVQGQTGRALGRVNVTTGLITTIGSTGQNFAGIAFDQGGTLYGVTGDGATTPETLYTISTATAQTSLVMPLGAGTDGETIAWGFQDGRLYHVSGLGTPNVDEIFEKIDPSTKTVTQIPLSGEDFEEATALHHVTGGVFFLADLNQDLFVIDDKGKVSKIGLMDHIAKGMAYLPTSTGAFNRAYGYGCAGPSAHTPVLVGRGTPSAGGIASLGLLNGAGGATGVIVLGWGSNVVPLVPGCDIQIAPVSPLFLPLSLSAGGAGDGTATLQFPLPPAILVTGYWQAAVFENNTITLTNPVVMRVR